MGQQKLRFESRKSMKSMLKATMYFSYGRDARSGVNLKTTFDAILAGERSSKTRFPALPGYERWRELKVGDRVRFFADRDMKGLCELTC
jgi:hypothetical protein